MGETVPAESAPAVFDARIKELKDWRGNMLAKVREIIHEADPEIVEEWKWVKATSPGVPVFSHGSIGNRRTDAPPSTTVVGPRISGQFRIYHWFGITDERIPRRTSNTP
jgi:hypothetical protein